MIIIPLDIGYNMDGSVICDCGIMTFIKSKKYIYYCFNLICVAAGSVCATKAAWLSSKIK